MAVSAALLLLATAWHASSLAQVTSTNFKLTGDVGSGGLGTSTSYRLFGTQPSNPAGRTTSPANDLFSGFVRAIGFSHMDTVRYSTKAGKFALVAFPLKRTNNAPTSVLPGLGAYNNTVWRLGHFDTANNKYLEPGSTGITTISNGLGYWLITAGANNNSLLDVGLPVVELPFLGAAGAYPLANGPSAAPGWNQMGNPFQYPIDVSHVWVTDNATFAGPVGNGGNTLTDHTIKVWNDTSSTYEDAATINGRQGFWVHKTSTAAVNMIFFAGGSTYGVPAPGLEAGGSSADLSSNAPVAIGLSSNAPVAQWAVSLTARQGDRSSEPMVMGAAAVAAGQWNSLCEALAPAPPDFEPLTLRQTRTDWGRFSGDYTRVFQPESDHMSWDFTVSGAESPGELNLRVESQGLPAGTRLWLTDRATGARQEMAPSGSFTLPAFADAHDYRIEAIGGSASQPSANLADEFMRAYPNPFRASTGLNFALARTGDVSVDIFDLQGRRVRSLERRGLAAGEHVLVWDGRDASGNLAGSGVYLTRWRAGELSGSGRLVKID